MEMKRLERPDAADAAVPDGAHDENSITRAANAGRLARSAAT
jgi:hypothetical protein